MHRIRQGARYSLGVSLVTVSSPFSCSRKRFQKHDCVQCSAKRGDTLDVNLVSSMLSREDHRNAAVGHAADSARRESTSGHMQRFQELSLSSLSTTFLKNSVILIPDFLTNDECKTLIEAAELHCKESVRGCLWPVSHGQGGEEIPRALKRLMRACLGLEIEAEPLERLRLCHLGTKASYLVDHILRDRLLSFMEAELPNVAEEIFGQSKGLSNLRFKFSLHEPAINRYTKGGGFARHMDYYALTVNVLLSSPERFTGGGTMFWQQDLDNTSDGLAASPTHLLHHQGMAVVFNGDVPHAGVPVESGVRYLLVASFDLVDKDVPQGFLNTDIIHRTQVIQSLKAFSEDSYP